MNSLTFLTLLLGAAAVCAAPSYRLRVALEPRFGDDALTFDTMTNQVASGQTISVTRLDFLLSNIALNRADGAWLGLTNWFAYVSLREGPTEFELKNIPAGSYDRIRFNIGMSPGVNRADPAKYPHGHPLNPNLNGLHWSWRSGYVFLALEGQWQTSVAADESSGYSYHIATDRHLMSVELPVAIHLSADHELRLTLDVAKIFDGTHTIALSDETTSTHSRQDDPLAGRLRRNIESAFDVLAISPTAASPSAHSLTGSPLIAPDATPYGLTISRFFPPPALPMDNPLTEEGVHLGRLLFFDPRLSINNSQSCASCHRPEVAFIDPVKAVSRGAEGQTGSRNSMPLFNLAWKSSFFWDGRATSLREQVLQPIQNPIEMHETLENVIAKLRSASVNARHEMRALHSAQSQIDQSRLKPTPARIRDYPTLFARAFGTSRITSDRIGRALEQFLLTQVSHDSKFDRVLRGEAEFTPEEKRGFDLFNTEYDPRGRQFGADCFHCHGGPLFQSQAFANNGLDAEPRDLGRFVVTGKQGDEGKFAVPSLRNVAVTAPYMHDGRFATLEQVIEHYASGVKRSRTLDPNLGKHPDGGIPLTASDKRAIQAFLTTLTDERFLASRDSSVRVEKP